MLFILFIRQVSFTLNIFYFRGGGLFFWGGGQTLKKKSFSFFYEIHVQVASPSHDRLSRQHLYIKRFRYGTK